MIDIHTHILPGADDGAADIEEALDICEASMGDGITTIVATPHHLNGLYLNNRESVLAMTAGLDEALHKRGLDIRVLPGSDVTMCTELPALLDSGEVMTLADTGAYMLLEPPLFFIPEAIKSTVFEINRRGITPIITHPERNGIMMSDITLLEDLVLAGALVQITAGSITGEFGQKARSDALMLIRSRLAHIVASDTHNMTTRKPGLAKARSVVEEMAGKEEASLMFEGRPEAVIMGEHIEPPAPQVAPRKKGLMDFLFPRGAA